MGFRTVVILSNDRHGDWSKDPQLGAKISAASHCAATLGGDFDGGRVVECCHADQQTLAVIDSLNMTFLTAKSWERGEDPEKIKIRLLRGRR